MQLGKSGGALECEQWRLPAPGSTRLRSGFVFSVILNLNGHHLAADCFIFLSLAALFASSHLSPLGQGDVPL